MTFTLKFTISGIELSFEDYSIKIINQNHFEVTIPCDDKKFKEMAHFMKKSPIVTFNIDDELKYGSINSMPYNFNEKQLTIKLVGITNG